MNRGACQATVHGVVKSRTRLSDLAGSRQQAGGSSSHHPRPTLEGPEASSLGVGTGHLFSAPPVRLRAFFLGGFLSIGVICADPVLH